MLVSQQIIAALGGSQEHLVAKKTKAREWMNSQIRKAMFPVDHNGKLISPGMICPNFRSFVKKVMMRLESIPLAQSGIEPEDRSPKNLASFLGVEIKPEDNLKSVCLRYLKKRFDEANEILKRCWETDFNLQESLDAWIPLLGAPNEIVAFIEKIFKLEADMDALPDILGETERIDALASELAKVEIELKHLADAEYPGKILVYKNKCFIHEPRSRFLMIQDAVLFDSVD